MSNSKSTQKTTFWYFLQNNKIEIPIIQRDYAQGRIGKESLRKSFLEDIKNALDKTTEMKLDFVYGSKENGCLYPLDGQQRLTTLWLLHWYIALMGGKLTKASRTLMKFSYETRISSREFCEKLCDPENFKNFFCGDIVSYITSRTWFYSSWKQDPTIQAMLRMLGGSKNSKNQNNNDGIEQVFKCHCFPKNEYKCCFLQYWNLLTDSDASRCPLVFYYISLDEFKLTDDLYIKMNARGEQLTSFENFKADLIGYMQQQKELNLKDEEWNDLLDAKGGIPFLLDTTWTEIFWRNKSKGTASGSMSNHIDEIYFAFLNRFFWNELFIAKKSDNPDEYVLDIGRGDENSTKENENKSYKFLNDSENPNDYDKRIAYKGFDVYQYKEDAVPKEFFKKLRSVLNRYSDFLKNGNSIPVCNWDKDFHFIPEYKTDEAKNNIEIINNSGERILEVTTLNQVQRIVFFALCKYFSDNVNKGESDDGASLSRWMRVVWNLVSGEDQNGRSQIRSTLAMRSAIRFIAGLNSHNVYESLESKQQEMNSPQSEFDYRCKEEIDKACQILDENSNIRRYPGCYWCSTSCGINSGMNRKMYQTWEDIIIDAENYCFFKGAIRFLFQDENGFVNWNHFDKKWENAQRYFDCQGVKDDINNGVKYKNEAMLLRYFISKINKWGDLWEFNYDNDASTWKSVLTSQRYNAIHNILIREYDTNNGFVGYNPENILVEGLDNNKRIKKIQYGVLDDLVTTNILGKVFEHHTRLNWRYSRYCLYPRNSKTPNNKFVLSDIRNDLLSDLIRKKKMETCQKIDDCDFFWGWDVNFTYNGRDFQWNTDGFIYLMRNGGALIKDETKEEIIDKFYCFGVDDNETKDSFIKKLDCLIAQAYPDEENKKCCDNCQEKICESTGPNSAETVDQAREGAGDEAPSR